MPQATARAACVAVTAYIHLTHPDLPLKDLDAKAEAAIRALENGAARVNVIDDLYPGGPEQSAPAAAKRPGS